MPSTQNRAPLGESLAFHSHRPASSLTARQYTSTLTSSTAFPDGKDSAIVDATGGAVNITLPAGSDSIIGLPFHAERADADAGSNTIALVCAGRGFFVRDLVDYGTVAPAHGNGLGKQPDSSCYQYQGSEESFHTIRFLEAFFIQRCVFQGLLVCQR